MKRKRFKAERIVTILKKAEREGATVADVCRAHGIGEQTYYRWKKTYSGMQRTQQAEAGHSLYRSCS